MDVYYVPGELITDISQTIDYTVLYRIIVDRMKKPSDLLETLVQEMDRTIRKDFLRQGKLTLR